MTTAHNLTTFTFPSRTGDNFTLPDAPGHPVRVVEIDGEPWFVAADVCAVLGLTNPSIATSRLDADEKAKFNLGFGSPANIVSESGLYDLIMQSRKPSAEDFKRWVRKEVLPAIRKDGAYVLGEEKVKTGEMDEDTLILRAMEAMQRKVQRLGAEREALLKENAEMHPKAVLAAAVLPKNQELRLTQFVRRFDGVENSVLV